MDVKEQPDLIDARVALDAGTRDQAAFDRWRDAYPRRAATLIFAVGMAGIGRRAIALSFADANIGERPSIRHDDELRI